MIRYALTCDRGHPSEGWFRDSDGYEEQVARGLVRCPTCGSDGVTKSVMAPSVASKGSTSDTGRDRAAVREAIRAAREHFERTTEWVGGRFEREVRDMHEGLADNRPVRGTLTPDQASGLLSDGIAVHPLPRSPDELN